MTTDQWSNVILADNLTDGSRIRVVASRSGNFYGQNMTAGNVYDVVGNGQVPTSDGGFPKSGQLAASADLPDPDGVAVDSNGNLLISTKDEVQPGVYAWDFIYVVAESTGTFYGVSMTQGDIYIIAGADIGADYGQQGSTGDGGSATSAEIDPADVAIDPQGNVVFADTADNRIRMVAENTCSSSCAYGLSSTTAGDIYTIAGDGTAGFAGDGGPVMSSVLNAPENVAFGPNGSLFIADEGNYRVRMVAASACSSNCPYGLSATQANYIYTVIGNGTAGSSANGTSALTSNISTTGVSVDSSGDIGLSDGLTSTVQLVPESGGSYFGIQMNADEIYTVAGNGIAGYSGDYGLATSAELTTPTAPGFNVLGQMIIGQSTALREVDGGVPVLQGVNPQGSAPYTDLLGGGSPSEVQCSACQGDAPSAAATGNYYMSATDMTVPGAGVPLSFTRTYNSEATSSGQYQTNNYSGLGYGWSDNLTPSFDERSICHSGCFTYATITEEDGSQILFGQNAQGSAEPSWCPPDASGPVWCAESPRVLATLTDSGNDYIFSRLTGDHYTFTFNSAGQVESIADQAGDHLTYQYNEAGSCPSGDTCAEVTSSASGQSLVLAYNSSGELVSVYDPVSGGQQATFSYSGCTSGQVCSASDPGPSEGSPVTTSYNYEGSGSYPNELSTLSSPSSGLTTNYYNSSGQLCEQDLGTSEPVPATEYAYAANPAVLDGTTTTVTLYPDGKGSGSPCASGSNTPETSVYQFSNDSLVESTNPDGTSTYYDLDPTTLLPYAEVDGNDNPETLSLQNYDDQSGGTGTSSGNVIDQTDAMGDVTQTAYNASNQPWCAVDASDTRNGVQCPASEPTSPPAAGSRSTTYLGATINYYDSHGNEIATTNSLGFTKISAYTSATGLLYCTVDAAEYSGHGVTCPAAPPTTAPTGQVTGYTTNIFDANGNLQSSTNPLGGTTQYQYDAPGLPGVVSQETSPDGDVTSYTYTPSGQVLTETTVFGTYSAVTEYGYDSAGQKFCEVDPLAYSTGTRCPAAAPTSPPTGTPGYSDTIYNSLGQVTSTTSAIGGTTQYAYDAAGNKYCTVDPIAYASGTLCPTSEPASPPTPSNDPYLGATIDTFDQDNQVIQETNPLGGISLKSYDGDGNVVQTVSEAKNTSNNPNITKATQVDADNRSTVTTVDPGAGSTTSQTEEFYDPNGNVYCSVSGNAVAAGGFQCPAWQPGWVLAPADKSNAFANPDDNAPMPAPNVLYSTSPSPDQANDVTMTFTNSGGQSMQSTTPDVATTVTVSDGDGRTYCTVDPTNLSTWLAANPSGTYPYQCPATAPGSPPAQGSNPGLTTTIYDADGDAVSSTDQAGDTTLTSYDSAGKETQVTDPSPSGAVTSYCYYFENGAGQCAASSSAGGGSADDLYSVTEPNGQATTTTYYSGSETEMTTSPAGMSVDTYDDSSDLLATTYSETAPGYAATPNISNSYYADGSRHTMTDGTGTTTYARDDLDDILTQGFSATGSGLQSTTTSYGYSTTGVLTSMTYPTYGSEGSPEINYTYDALGNMASETDWLGNTVDFSHDNDGNLTAQNNAVSEASPTGTSSTLFSYDPADKNSSDVSTLAQTCGGSETLAQSFSGTGGSRNPDGQLTADTGSYNGSCSGQGSSQTDYSYDVAGKVVYEGTSSQGTSPNNFAYDPAGDPTTISSHDTSDNFDTYTQTFNSAGQVTDQTPVVGSAGVATTYGYDSLGDQTNDASGSTDQLYGFDQTGQMVGASSTASMSSAFLYNGDGLDVATSNANSASWGDAVINANKVFESVSCAGETMCAGGDSVGNIYVATDLDGTQTQWTKSTPDTRSITGISCASPAFCIAVDSAGYTVNYNGSNWTLSSGSIDSEGLTSVSCPTDSFCVAADKSGNVDLYNGGIWTMTNVGTTQDLASVSCPTPRFCVVVNQAGRAFLTTNGGSTWLKSAVDGTTALDAVSCASPLFCLAGDANGDVLTYNGTSWSSPENLFPTAIESISCVSSLYCAVGGSNGKVKVYNGLTWTLALSSGSSANAVSCTSLLLCVALNAAGQDLIEQPSASQLIWSAEIGTNSSLVSDGTNDYIYGPSGEPVEQINITTSPPESNPIFLTYSASNSTWLATNSAGDELGFTGYDAYGSLSFGTPTSPFGFAGQYQGSVGSSATDYFYDLRARWYDPQTGEFTSVTSNQSTTNTYEYASDDPVNPATELALRSNGSSTSTVSPNAGPNGVAFQQPRFQPPPVQGTSSGTESPKEDETPSPTFSVEVTVDAPNYIDLEFHLEDLSFFVLAYTVGYVGAWTSLEGGWAYLPYTGSGLFHSSDPNDVEFDTEFYVPDLSDIAYGVVITATGAGPGTTCNAIGSSVGNVGYVWLGLYTLDATTYTQEWCTSDV